MYMLGSHYVGGLIALSLVLLLHMKCLHAIYDELDLVVELWVYLCVDSVVIHDSTECSVEAAIG